MIHRLSLAGVTLALVFSLAGAARADTDYRTGRVSDLRGQLAVRGDDESDISYIDRNGVVREGDVLWTEPDTGRAELELDRDVWVRLADDTKLEVRRLRPTAELRLWNGAVYLDVSDRLAEPVHVRTPSGDIDVDPKSLVRVDLSKNDSVRVSVIRGLARVTGDRGDTVKVRSEERVYLDPNQDPDRPKQFDVADRDTFDTYDRDRIDYIVSRPLPPDLEHDVIGARDLSDYGEWVEVDHVNYWRPRCGPDWRPYSAGYWSYVPGCGYTWIDSAPWGYTTCHYGRWLYRPAAGWLWYPSYEWAPAYVSWASYNGYCGWAPLDPWDHPAFCAAGGGGGVALSFRIGGIGFDYRSWTFCPTNQFYYSRPALVIAGGGRPYYSGRDIHITNVNVTNVKIVNNYYNVVGVPQQTVRGLTVTRDGRSARDTVLQVENRIPEHRQALIQQRFKVEAKRDLVAARRPSEIERFQRDPQPRVEAFHVLKGEEAARKAPAFANTNRVPPAESRGVKPPSDNATAIRGGNTGPGRAATGTGSNGSSGTRTGDRDGGFRRGGDRAGDRGSDRTGDRANDRGTRGGDSPRTGNGRNDGSPSRTDSNSGRGTTGNNDRDGGFRRGGSGNNGSTGSGSNGADRTGPRGNDRGGSGTSGGDRTGPRGNDRGGSGTSGGDRTGPRGNDRGGSGTSGGDRTGPRGNDRSGSGTSSGDRSGSGSSAGDRGGSRGNDRSGSGTSGSDRSGSRGNDRGGSGTTGGDRTGPRGNDRGGSGTSGGDRTGPRGSDRSGTGTAGTDRSGSRGNDRGGNDRGGNDRGSSGTGRGTDRGTGNNSGNNGAAGKGDRSGGDRDRDSGGKNKNPDSK